MRRGWRDIRTRGTKESRPEEWRKKDQTKKEKKRKEKKRVGRRAQAKKSEDYAARDRETKKDADGVQQQHQAPKHAVVAEAGAEALNRSGKQQWQGT
jgi:hypothetical protein